MNLNNPSDPLCLCERAAAALPRFPYGQLCGAAGLIGIGGVFVYRLSETGGKTSETACLWAIVIALAAAAIGVVPIIKTWGRQLLWVLLGFFLSGVIRLLIGALGVGIIFLFTSIDRIQFVGFLAFFYTAFLAADTWLALWILRNTRIENEIQETAIHGNVWDFIGKSQSTSRSGQ
jgi:hypothetical protein